MSSSSIKLYIEGVLRIKLCSLLQEKGQLDAATQKKIADTQRDMVKKMCTTNGHLTISIARYVHT